MFNFTNGNDNFTIESKDRLDNQQKKSNKKKPAIFNNKINNQKCSLMLSKAFDNVHEVLQIPYAKEKQKVAKKIHEIGQINNVPYENVSCYSFATGAAPGTKICIEERHMKINQRKNEKKSFNTATDESPVTYRINENTN